MQLGKGCKSGISAENIGRSESNRSVGQVSNKQLCGVPEILTREPSGKLSHPGETQFASDTSKNKRSDKNCYEMMPLKHIGSHQMQMHLKEFQAEHYYYFKAVISFNKLKLVDVGHADKKEITNVICKLSTAVRGDVHNSATTVYVDEVDLVRAVRQIAVGFRTSTGFLNETRLGITGVCSFC